eukprot:1177248-Prorocentrum_minimum.AAC.1
MMLAVSQMLQELGVNLLGQRTLDARGRALAATVAAQRQVGVAVAGSPTPLVGHLNSLNSARAFSQQQSTDNRSRAAPLGSFPQAADVKPADVKNGVFGKPPPNGGRSSNGGGQSAAATLRSASLADQSAADGVEKLPAEANGAATAGRSVETADQAAGTTARNGVEKAKADANGDASRLANGAALAAPQSTDQSAGGAAPASPDKPSGENSRAGAKFQRAHLCRHPPPTRTPAAIATLMRDNYTRRSKRRGRVG